ncbi:hypothetical protein MIND_00085400 [Mycena indigotica]|uniref:DUF221-domain-containing protein n=1 Tax=Mycena indigotica TaxID=2126181 RepID=A0A8H6TDI3_9AGAR|nr:uncharacterized protein MIND_00085400 [Mycena indigotica]KAF7315698.1 hypothetical protein MIND_00085400 [Mycena indigotica]
MLLVPWEPPQEPVLTPLQKRAIIHSHFFPSLMSAVSSSQATSSTSNSTKTFVTALVANGALLAAEIAAFVILKNRLGRIYSPRTYLPPPAKRAHKLPAGVWRWFPALLVEDATDIIAKNGLDAYMVLRFIRLLIIIFATFTLSTFLVIVPVDIVGIPEGNDPINRITWTNIPTDDQKRFAAHIIMAYLLTFFVIYLIRREMLHFLDMRHKFLVSKSHSRLAQAKTVLITSVPPELGNEHDLRLFASFVPGGIDRVWIYRDTKALNKLFEERQSACSKLENAESKLLKHATDQWRIKELAHRKLMRRKTDQERGDMPLELAIPAEPSQELLDELVPEKVRPKHRIGLFGIFGRKVDTISWCTEEIARLNTEIEEARQHIVKGKFLGSVFIRCNLQLGAHVLAQCVSHHQPLAMSDRWMETSPKDIVWNNLDDGALEMTWRYVVSWLATVGLIIAYGFPVIFIGTLSSVDDLCSKVHWLAWVCKAPTPIPGIIQGVLPPAFLAILFALLPILLWALAWFECIPRYSLIAVSVYRRFFLFLLVHGFLIVTLSSGVATLISDIIDRPTQTVQQLAYKLPKVSIFFLTYMVAQGLAGAGAAMAQLFPIILHFVKKWFLGRTPRQAFNVTFKMPAADFSLILPRLSLLATIGFVYSLLNPLINLFALLSYFMFYLAFKFLLTQVYDQPDESETGGMYFPMAVSNLFVGLYIEQISLACLFFLKASVAPKSSVAEGAMMLVLLAITIGAHIMFDRMFGPSAAFLPMSLATKKMAKRYEKHQHKQGIPVTPEDEELDLFKRQALRSVRRIKHLPHAIDHTLLAIKAKVKEEGEHLALPKAAREKLADDERRHAKAEADAEIGRPSTSKEPVSGKTETQKEAEKAVMSDLKNGDAPELYRKSSSSSRESKASSARRRPPVKKQRSNPMADVDLSEEDVSTDEEEETDENAFDHPSTYQAQRWIWVPKDRLGLSRLLVDNLHRAGVDASDEGAVMDERGVVEATRNPPDEDWAGGWDA